MEHWTDIMHYWLDIANMRAATYLLGVSTFVGVMFQGTSLVSLLDLGLCSILGDANNLVKFFVVYGARGTTTARHSPATHAGMATHVLEWIESTTTKEHDSCRQSMM
jgi:hypothetical protein